MTERARTDTQSMDFRLRLGRPARTSDDPEEELRQLELLVQRERQLDQARHAHDTHHRAHIGRCVYCLDCRLRLYQGELR